MVAIVRYVIRKVLTRFITFFIILSLTFIIPRLLPGGAFAYLIANPSVSPDLRLVLIKQFGLDKPLWKQYIIFLKEFFTTGSLGISFSRLKPVGQVIFEALPWTIILVTTATVVAALLGIFLGLYAAYRRGGFFDSASLTLSMLIRSMPGFWMGMVLLIVFGYYLGWAPLYGIRTYGVHYGNAFEYLSDVLYHLWLPMITLIIISVPGYVVLMRNSVVSILGEDFIVSARAMGYSDRKLLLKWVLRPASPPVLTALAMDVGFSIGGAMLIERVFSIPGVGSLAYDAVYMQDYPLLLGTVVYTSALTLILVTIVEIMYAFIDPRVRLE